ncbi:MAG: transketolase family protein [Thermoprotei archaeon]|nr:MAG: transketolase family protein [Thermoprotei archaeon]
MTAWKIRSWREAFSEKLVELGREIKSLVVLDADVAKSTRTNMFQEAFPSRFFNIGISEQDMVGIAAGMAIEGFIPVVSTFSMFILRAWEQIRNTIARNNLNVKIVTTHAGLSSFSDGSSHQCLEDIALMRVIPNMEVIVPADATATKVLLEDMVIKQGPCYMRIGRDFAPVVYEDGFSGKTGFRIVAEGEDIALLACGLMVPFSLRVREILKKQGINACVVDVYRIKPLNRRLVSLCERIGCVVTVEEHSVIGGLGSAICELLSEKGVRIKIIGVNDRFGESSLAYLSLLKKFELDVKSIARRILDFWRMIK